MTYFLSTRKTAHEWQTEHVHTVYVSSGIVEGAKTMTTAETGDLPVQMLHNARIMAVIHHSSLHHMEIACMDTRALFIDT